MKKLAIVVPSDEETWEYELSLRCFQCDGEQGAVVTSEDPKVSAMGRQSGHSANGLRSDQGHS